MKRITPPFKDQTFASYEQWVSRARSWLTRHPDQNNTEHGEEGWRGHHFTAMCFDILGRRCRIGADFKKATADNAYPIWWIWPDQIVSLIQPEAVKGSLDWVEADGSLTASSAFGAYALNNDVGGYSLFLDDVFIALAGSQQDLKKLAEADHISRGNRQCVPLPEDRTRDTASS